MLLIAAAIALSHSVVRAQTNVSGNAQQAVNLGLSNALEITFASNNSTTGSTVAIPFTSVNDYASGVESTVQTLNIRSNKNFKIAVKTSSGHFSVTNNGVTTTSSMPVSVLGIKIASNNTGGSLGAGFSTSTYKALSSSSKTMINNATAGGSNSVAVQYKATPGFTYPAGTYNINVIYTATQL